MVLVKILTFREGNYYLWLLVWPDTEIAAYIKSWT